MKEITILGEKIAINEDYIDIHSLKFLRDNPRVYASTHGVSNFEDKTEEEQQDTIFNRLSSEPSVKNLKPDIKRHGGLMEWILVRHDTMEVIEGNSRLAVYRQLHEDEPENDAWRCIPCNIVSRLTDKQQAAFLNQIHVKGKTQWSAFEKANFAYVRKEKGMPFKEIAELFGESEATIRIRTKSIEKMAGNEDNKPDHFSYYNVLVRNQGIIDGMKSAGGLENLLADIKQIGPEEDGPFTALDLRKKLPMVLKKPKVLKKYIARKIDLDQAYQLAKIARVEENIRQATVLLKDVSKGDVSRLERGEFNAFKLATRRLAIETDRIKGFTQEVDEKK